ncbi:hypothetical protein IJ843_08015 [bacterium]|nr:hypothetical protein [bacterium]
MKKYKDISRLQDRMLKIGEELRSLEYITKSFNHMISYRFSQEEIGYMAEIIYEIEWE